MYHWGKPQFYGVRAAAANIGSGAPGNYTAEQFQEDFPQFFNAEGQPLLPAAMLQGIIRMANAAVQPERWGEGWRYAVGLYVAHYVTLYLRGYAASNETPEQAAASTEEGLTLNRRVATVGRLALSNVRILFSGTGIGMPPIVFPRRRGFFAGRCTFSIGSWRGKVNAQSWHIHCASCDDEK